MGSLPPEKAPGASVQQLSRQVQMAVTEALRTLDKIKAVDPASQDEVESLRSVIWSNLTGLEAEFSREEEPRAELLNRFFSHLLSNGDHIGQIESLAGALLGGAPPPSQPPPDSPVAGLFQLHGALTTIRQQWQEAASTPSEAAEPAVQPPLVPIKRGVTAKAKEAFFDEMGLPPLNQEAAVLPSVRGQALAERSPTQPPRQSASDRFFDEMGYTNSSVPGRTSDVETSRPRVLMSFIVVFVILGLMGVGVIWLGLNAGSQDSTGIVPSVVPTFSTDLPSQTVQPTPTLNPADPVLQITGNPLLVPCPGQGTNGFVLSNVGGQTLTWSAKVNRAGGSSQPVTLSATNGKLYGPLNSGTDTVTVTVTAKLGNIDGTITITTNTHDTQVIVYHIHGC
jgi:hypothetical protein